MKKSSSLSHASNKYTDKYGVRLLKVPNYSESRSIQSIEFENMSHFIDITDALYKDEEYINHGKNGGAYDHVSFETRNSNKKWKYGMHENYEGCRTNLLEGRIPDKMMSMIEDFRAELGEKESIKELAHQAKSTKRKRVFAEDGSELSIDRLMSGDPNYWQSMTKGRKSNTVRIDIDPCVGAGTSEKQFAQITALSFVAIEYLLMAGYAVEVYASFCFKKVTDKVIWGNISIPLKVGDDQVDMQLIAQLGNIGLFRNFIFRTTPMFDGNVSAGIGVALEPDEDVKSILSFGNYISCKWDTGKSLLAVDKMFQELCKIKEVEYV